jgi:hypothetical protein
MKRLLMILACSLLWLTPAGAQTCIGSVSFAEAPLQATGLAAFSSSTQTYLGSVAKGTDSWFGRGGAHLTSFSFDSSAKGIFIGAGSEYPVGTGGKYKACPLVEITKSWGPSPGINLDRSSLMVSVGGSVGWEQLVSGTTRVMPTVGLSFDYLRSTLEGDTGFGKFKNTDGSAFANLQLGVGLLFHDTMSLTPGIIVPFGLDGAAVSFGVRFTTKIR